MASDFEAKIMAAAIEYTEVEEYREDFTAGARWAYEEGRRAGLEQAYQITESHTDWAGRNVAHEAAKEIRALLDKKPGKGGE